MPELELRSEKMKRGNHMPAKARTRWIAAPSLIALEGRTCGARVCVSRLPSACVVGMFLCLQLGEKGLLLLAFWERTVGKKVWWLYKPARPQQGYPASFVRRVFTSVSCPLD